MKALEELDTIYRDPAGRVIKPDETNLSSPGHHLLMTKAGPLDLLGELAPGKGYGELIQNVITYREKDGAVLSILRKTLEEKKKKSKE